MGLRGLRRYEGGGGGYGNERGQIVILMADTEKEEAFKYLYIIVGQKRKVKGFGTKSPGLARGQTPKGRAPFFG